MLTKPVAGDQQEAAHEGRPERAGAGWAARRSAGRVTVTAARTTAPATAKRSAALVSGGSARTTTRMARYVEPHTR